MRFAFINDNKVAKIEEHESADLILDGHHYQQVIDVTDRTYGPEVGWTYDNGTLYLDLPDVTPRQIRQAFVLAGLLTSFIEDAFAALPEPTKSFAQIEWEYSLAFKRRRPLVVQVGQMLGWTEKQLDDLWILAGKL
jgi:hypothetical protein